MKNQIKHAVLAATLAALAPAALADIKVGFLATLSGPSADVGRDQLDGFNLALEQLGGKLGGVSATVIREDDQQKPEAALGGLSKLLERDKVDVVTGLTFANILMALQGRIAATDVPFVGSVAGPSAAAGAGSAAPGSSTPGAPFCAPTRTPACSWPATVRCGHVSSAAP